MGIYPIWNKKSQWGFGPAAELVAWRVPQGATVVVEQKDPKPCWSCPGPSGPLCGSPIPAAHKLAALKHCAPFLRCRLHCSATSQDQMRLGRQGILLFMKNQFAALGQGLPGNESVRHRYLPTGVDQEEEENRGLKEIGGAFHHLRWIFVGVHLSSNGRWWATETGMILKFSGIHQRLLLIR